jgi:hypothetical protein
VTSFFQAAAGNNHGGMTSALTTLFSSIRAQYGEGAISITGSDKTLA